MLDWATETVAVLTRSEAGRDAMGEPVYEWEPTLVGGALVRPLPAGGGSQADGASHLRPDGFMARYRISLPATYAGPPLAHARVALVDRGMDARDAESAYLVDGDPAPVKVPNPSHFNMRFEVGRFHG